MGEQETRVQVCELAKLELRCKECGSALVFDFSNRKTVPFGESNLAKQCPSCREMFPDGTDSAVSLYQKFFKTVADNKAIIEFHVKSS
jgi:hypothetical protein